MHLAVVFLLFVAVEQARCHVISPAPIPSFTRDIDDLPPNLFMALNDRARGFYYAVRDLNVEKKKHIIDVIQEYGPSYSDVSYKKVCYVKVAKSQESIYEKEWALVPLPDNRVCIHPVSRTAHTTEMSIYLVNMNTCAVKEVTIPTIRMGAIVPEEERFSVVGFASDLTLCDGGTSCRFIYDYEGNKLEKPTAFLKELQVPNIMPFFKPMVCSNTNTSYIQFLLHGSNILYKAQENKLTLVQLAKSEKFLSTTMKNDSMAVCWVIFNNYIRCRKFDNMGQELYTANITYLVDSISWDKRQLSVHILRDEGLLVTIINNHEDIDYVSVFKTSKDGSIENSIDIHLKRQSFSCATKFRVFDFEDLHQPQVNVVEEDDDICIQIICMKTLRSSNLKFVMKCIPNRVDFGEEE